jgi:hypothetical protein
MSEAEEAFLDATATTEEPEQADPRAEARRRRLEEAGKERNRGHAERPDPDEPWRYACPDCGDYKIVKIRGGTKPPGKKYAWYEQDERRRDELKRYTCTECSERKMHLIDRKSGDEARP